MIAGQKAFESDERRDPTHKEACNGEFLLVRRTERERGGDPDPASGFDLRAYDDIWPYEKKQAAALADLRKAYPYGKAIKPLARYLSAIGTCESHDHSLDPEKDWFRTRYIFCRVSYQDPKDTSGVIYVTWNVKVVLDVTGATVADIRLNWERVFLGG
jgi:hypothetical protein